MRTIFIDTAKDLRNLQLTIVDQDPINSRVSRTMDLIKAFEFIDNDNDSVVIQHPLIVCSHLLTTYFSKNGVRFSVVENQRGYFRDMATSDLIAMVEEVAV